MRIVIMSWRDLTHPNAGGSEVVSDRYAKELQKLGHEVVLLCGGPAGVHSYRTESLGGTYSQYLRAPVVARRFRDWDLLIDVSNGVPYFSPLWWRRPRLCLYHHVHDEQWHHYFRAPVAHLGSFIERRVVPIIYRGTEFAAVSESTATGLRKLGVDEPRIHVVHSGLDPEVLGEPCPEACEPLFLFLGRIARNKDIDRLLRMWTAVRPATGGRLVIAGDGPERARLEALEVPDATFIGHVDDATKLELLGSAWILMHAAPREGWGMVVLEAAAQRTPTIAFDVEGVRDAVVDGQTGILATDEQAFRDAWIGLAGDRHRRAQLGESARIRARQFTWTHAVEDLLQAAAAAGAR